MPLFDNENPLFKLAYDGNLSEVCRIIQNDPSLISIKTQEDGETLVMTAVRRGHLELFQWLIIEGKAPLTEKDNYGCSILLHAAESGQIEVMKWLLDSGRASLDEKDNYGSSALLIAAASGQIEVMKWLLDSGKASLVEKSNYGSSALLIAAANGQIEVMKWLLDSGKASFAEKDNNGHSALHLAVYYKNIDVVTYILENHMISYKFLLESIELSVDEKITDLLLNYQLSIERLIKEEGKIKIDDEFICPITFQFIIDPILAPDGKIYEKKVIEQWLEKNPISPITSKPMTLLQLVPNLFVNRLLKEKLDEIDSFLARRFALMNSLRISHSAAGFFAEGGGSVVSPALQLTNGPTL